MYEGVGADESGVKNNYHLNTTPLFNHRLACLVSVQVHNMTESNFSEPETDAKTRKKIIILCCLTA